MMRNSHFFDKNVEKLKIAQRSFLEFDLVALFRLLVLLLLNSKVVDQKPY